MITNKLKQTDTIIAATLFLFFIVLYVYTAAPGVYSGDSGELAALINEVGLAHPTGFPLYILLGKLFATLVPIKDTAYRLNVFSSFLTAAAIGIMFAVFRSLNIKRTAAILASFILGFGSTVWSHAGTARVYPLSFLFAALLFFVFLKWLKSRQPLYIYVYTFLLALSFGGHFLSVLMILPFIFILWSTYKNLSTAFSLKKIIVLFLLPLIQYLFLFWANGKNSIFNWGMTSSFRGFIDYMTQRDFSFKIAAPDNGYFGGLLIKAGVLFLSEFTLLFFFFFVSGIFIVFKKNARLGSILLSIIFANVFIMLLYGTSNDLETGIIFRYFFISYLAMSVFIAVTLNFLYEKVRNPIFSKILTSTIVVLIIFLPLKTNYEKNNRHSNYIVSDLAYNTLRTMEPDSLFIAEGDIAIFPLLYLQITGQRKDIIVIAQQFLSHDWYIRQLNKNYPDVVPAELLQKKGLDNADTIKMRRRKIIEINFNKLHIYTNFFNSGTLENFRLIPRGVIYKLEPRDWNAYHALKEANDKIWNTYETRGLDKIYYESDLNKIPLFYPAILNNLSSIFWNAGFKEEAVEFLEKAIGINPNYELARTNLKKIKK